MTRWGGWVLGAALAAAGGAAAHESGEHSAERARYAVEIHFEWSAETHPVGFPDNPHFSSLVAVTHNRRYALFADGATATSGLALIATNGRLSVIRPEIEEAQRRGRVYHYVEAPGRPADAGPKYFELTPTLEHPFASFATMLAPSPDWFTGVASVDLRGGDVEGDGWIDALEVTLWVWDAGVDRGSDYTTPNTPHQPQESIRLAAGPQFLGPTGLRPVGRVVFTQIADPDAAAD